MLLPSKNKTSPFLLVDRSTDSEIPLKETADHINTFFAYIGPSLACLNFPCPSHLMAKSLKVKWSH